MASSLRACVATLVVLGASFGQACAKGLPSASRDLDFLMAGGAARIVQFDARAHERWLAFTASAGEAVGVSTASSSFGEACDVSADVLDERGDLVAHEACVAGSREALSVTAPRAGTYRVRLNARPGVPGRLELTLTSQSARVPVAADCQPHTLVLDQPANGAWDTSCASVSFAGHYAQYYTFTVPASQVISISLSSSTNAYLVLHDGATGNGTTLASDDDSGPGTDALIVRVLAAGTYTIEATTAVAGQLGNFTVAARTDTAPCFAALKLDKSTAGSWSTSCESQRFADTYAKFYTFTLASDQVVTLSLGADHIDPYLVLRYGATPLGTILAEDDNSGPVRSALIVLELAAGTYTLEATTVQQSQLGDFTISARTDTAPCFASLPLDKSTKGKWTATCASTFANDHYAQFYAFTVPSPQIVTMSLSSSTDPLLVLRLGASPIGTVIATDNNSGAGTDARIVMTLDAGTYTLEATTAKVHETGTFQVAARTDSAPCFTAEPLTAQVADALTTDCTSTTFDDRYAKYYVISVPAPQSIAIQLASSFDNYLVLRGGPDMQLGPIVAQDDNSGGGTNAKIATTLQPGTYTIEATSASTLQQGAFTLTIGP